LPAANGHGLRTSLLTRPASHNGNSSSMMLSPHFSPSPNQQPRLTMGTTAARAKLGTALEEAEPWSADDLFVDARVLGPDGEPVNKTTRPVSHIGCSQNNNDAKKRHDSEWQDLHRNFCM
jgi:hypothetical protein